MEISETRLATALAAVFGLGVLLSIFNGQYIEETGNPMPVVTYGVAGVGILVGALIIFLFQSRIDNKNALKLLKALSVDEQKILEVLLKEKKIEQTYLVAETGLSKVKVSRILSKLAERGVVEKKQLGNTNLVKLKI